MQLKCKKYFGIALYVYFMHVYFGFLLDQVHTTLSTHMEVN